MFFNKKKGFDEVEQYQKMIKQRSQSVNQAVNDLELNTRGKNLKQKIEAKNQEIQRRALEKEMQTKTTSDSPRSLGNPKTPRPNSKNPLTVFIRTFLVITIASGAIPFVINEVNNFRDNHGFTFNFNSSTSTNKWEEWFSMDTPTFLQQAQIASENNVDYVFNNEGDTESRLLQAINEGPFSISLKNLSLMDSDSLKWLCPTNNNEQLMFNSYYCGIFLQADSMIPRDFWHANHDFVSINTNLLLDLSPEDTVYFIGGEYFSKDQINTIQQWYLNQ